MKNQTKNSSKKINSSEKKKIINSKEINDDYLKKEEERHKRFELIQNSRNKELLKLEIKLLRKLYIDLFISLPNTFKENNLSFENFVFQFGQKIHEICELDQNYENNSYDNLLKEVNLLILRKYPLYPDLTKFNKRELKKYFYDLGMNEDWTLIQRYQQEMDKLEERQRLKKIAQSMKDYYNDLNKQIETKKIIKENEEKKKKKDKNKIDLNKMRLINKQKIKKLKENEKMIKMLDEEKIKQINENDKMKQYYLDNLEEENYNLNEDNYNLIKYKLDNAINIQTKQMQNYNQKFFDLSKINSINTGYSIPDEQLSFMVDQIMNKKNQGSLIDNIIKDKKNNDEIKIQNDKIEGIDYDIEKKVNKILSEQRLKKFKK
jgi:hypothetical protein